MEYIDLFKRLNQDSIRYLICGGLAVNIYGIPRMTADIDLLLDFEEQNIDRFDVAVKLLSYQSVVPVALKTYLNKEERQKAIREKNLIAYSYFNSRANYVNLDILMDTPLPFDVLWSSRVARPLDDFEINLISIPHLIEMKKYANRQQDQDDIILLSKFLKS